VKQQRLATIKTKPMSLELADGDAVGSLAPCPPAADAEEQRIPPVINHNSPHNLNRQLQP
jgi:hypothetical protein